MDEVARRCARRHLRFGWSALLGFLTLGILLEVLNGFKVGWYVDVAHETRRHLWTLAHAHGTLLALVNVVFALTLPSLGSWSPGRREFTSHCLLVASLLVPLGFLLGGAVVHAGDPGLGILLLPFGALLLLAAVALVALAQRSS